MNFSLAISKNRVPYKNNMWLIGCTLAFGAAWINSLVGTTDISNWLLENVLVFIFLFFLIGSYRAYQFSDLSYLLICIYLCLHVYGSKHTYADNPFGFWLQDVFDLSRNHYDRIVHFSAAHMAISSAGVVWAPAPRT